MLFGGSHWIDAAMAGVKNGLGRVGLCHGRDDFVEIKYICLGGVDRMEEGSA